MPKKPVLAVLMGGKSSEHEISLQSGKNVIDNLDKDKYTVIPIKISKNNQFIRAGKMQDPKQALQGIDLAFLTTHGEYGEDGALQGLLEFLGVNYIGSGVEASALAMDKIRSGQLFSDAGLKVPDYKIIYRCFWNKDKKIAKQLAKTTTFPCVVKPAFLGSSVGVNLVPKKRDLAKALATAFNACEIVLIADYIAGTEITVSVLENKGHLTTLPITQIIPPKNCALFSWEAKYSGQSQEITPAHLDEQIVQQASQTALICHQVLGCRDLSRTDMIIAENGQIFVLELNTLPGLTKNSLLPQQALAQQITFHALLDQVIANALERIK